MQRRTLCFCFSILVVVGVLLLVGGLTLHYIAPSLIESKVAENVVLKNGSLTFDAWLNPPAPIFIEFYLFNLTNPEAVLNDGAKPNLQQIGPYTYKEIREKVDVQFSEDGVYLDYKTNKYYVFDRNNSSGPESDWFTGINLPMLTIANMLQHQLSWGQQIALNMFLTAGGVQLFNNYTVGQYLWGYKDPFFATSKEWLIKFGKNETAAKIPDEYGLFVGNKGNGTNDGVWRIHTGKGDSLKLNKIISWNGNSSVSYWNTEWANQINGTDASMWHPNIQKDERLYMFASDIGRSGAVVFKKEIEHKGLNLYRFGLSPDLLGSKEEFPVNADFCTPPGNCLKGGVLNMSVCNRGAPIILSQPHFTGADATYQNAVIGMRPSEDLETKLDVEPMTGAVLHAVKHLQFNAYISPMEAFPDTLEMNATVYPIMWVNETGGITTEGAAAFKDKVYGPLFMLTLVCYCCMGLGAALLLVVLVVLALRAFKKVGREELVVVFNKDENMKNEKKVNDKNVRDPASSAALMKHRDGEAREPQQPTGYVATVESLSHPLKNNPCV